MPHITNKPTVGSRWRDKTLHDILGVVVEDEPDTLPCRVSFRFDRLKTVAVFELQHFLDWLEPVPDEQRTT